MKSDQKYAYRMHNYSAIQNHSRQLWSMADKNSNSSDFPKCGYNSKKNEGSWKVKEQLQNGRLEYNPQSPSAKLIDGLRKFKYE